MSEALTDRQRRYVENMARGLESRAAALAAGYSASVARNAAYRLGRKPAIEKAIEAIRSKGRELAVYDLATAMKEAEAVCVFAQLHKNAMAYCKGTELRAKLSGLLIDQVQVVTVDLTAALAKAEARVNTPLGAGGLGALSPLQARAGIDWKPRIPGSRSAEEAEPDIESESKP